MHPYGLPILLVLSSALAAAEWDLADLDAAWRDLSTATSPAIRLRGAVMLALDGDPRSQCVIRTPTGTWIRLAAELERGMAGDDSDEPLARPWAQALDGRTRSAMALLDGLPPDQAARGEAAALRAFITRDPAPLAAAGGCPVALLVRGSLSRDRWSTDRLSDAERRRIGPLARGLVELRYGAPWGTFNDLGAAAWDAYAAFLRDQGDAMPAALVRHLELRPGERPRDAAKRWVRRAVTGLPWVDPDAAQMAWLDLERRRGAATGLTAWRISAIQEQLAVTPTAVRIACSAMRGEQVRDVFLYIPPTGVGVVQPSPGRGDAVGANGPLFYAGDDIYDDHRPLVYFGGQLAALVGRVEGDLDPGSRIADIRNTPRARDEATLVRQGRLHKGMTMILRGSPGWRERRLDRVALAYAALDADLPWAWSDEDRLAEDDPWDLGTAVVAAAARMVRGAEDLGTAPAATAAALPPITRWAMDKEEPWGRLTAVGGDTPLPVRLTWDAVLEPGAWTMTAVTNGALAIELDGAGVLRLPGQARFGLHAATAAVAVERPTPIRIRLLGGGDRVRFTLSLAGPDGAARPAGVAEIHDGRGGAPVGRIERGPWPRGSLFMRAVRSAGADLLARQPDRMDVVVLQERVGHWQDWPMGHAASETLLLRSDLDPDIRPEIANNLLQLSKHVRPERYQEDLVRWGPELVSVSSELIPAVRALGRSGCAAAVVRLLDPMRMDDAEIWDAYLDGGAPGRGFERIFEHYTPGERTMYSRALAGVVLGIAAGRTEEVVRMIEAQPPGSMRCYSTQWRWRQTLDGIRLAGLQQAVLDRVTDEPDGVLVLAGLDLGRLPDPRRVDALGECFPSYRYDPEMRCWSEWQLLRALLRARAPGPADGAKKKTKPITVPERRGRDPVPASLATAVAGIQADDPGAIPADAADGWLARWGVIWAVAHQDLPRARLLAARIPADQAVDRAAALRFLAWAEGQGVEALAAHPVWGRRPAAVIAATAAPVAKTPILGGDAPTAPATRAAVPPPDSRSPTGAQGF